MKTRYILPSLLAVAASAYAGEPVEQPDTLFMAQSPDRIVITENAQGLSVEALTDSVTSSFKVDYPENSVVKSSQNSWTAYRNRTMVVDITALGGIHFGFDGMVGHDRMGSQMGKSFEIGIDNLLAGQFHFNHGRDKITIGLGINWRNYRMTGSQTRFVTDDTMMTTGPYPEGCEGKCSFIKMFSLGFPVMYAHSFPFKVVGNDPFTVHFGAILNWNSHASLQTRWLEADGTEAKYSNNHIGQRKFTVDIYASFSIARSTKVYFKFCPQTFFESGRGPEFRTFSTGITLFW